MHFASTFKSRTSQILQKSLPTPTHLLKTIQQKMNITTDEKEHRTANTGLAKVAVQCSSATAETHLWLIKIWFSASIPIGIGMVKIANFL